MFCGMLMNLLMTECVMMMICVASCWRTSCQVRKVGVDVGGRNSTAKRISVFLKGGESWPRNFLSPLALKEVGTKPLREKHKRGGCSSEGDRFPLCCGVVGSPECEVGKGLVLLPG